LFDVAAFNTKTSSFVADNMSAIIFSSSAFLVLIKSVNNPGATDNRSPESSNYLNSLVAFSRRCTLINQCGLLLVCNVRDEFFLVVRAVLSTVSKFMDCGEDAFVGGSAI
jgi:hypothetical protein